MYQALVEGSVDVINGFTTDGRIAAFHLVVLEDDLHFFPPYDAVVMVRGEVFEEYSVLRDVLNNTISSLISHI